MIYTGSRRSGKTTELIKLSHATNYPIVCSSSTQVKIIEENAKTLNLTIPKPLSVGVQSLQGISADKVLVDELDIVLTRLLGKAVHAATTSEVTQNLCHEASIGYRDALWFKVTDETSFYHGTIGKEIVTRADGVVLDIIVSQMLGGIHRVYLQNTQVTKVL